MSITLTPSESPSGSSKGGERYDLSGRLEFDTAANALAQIAETLTQKLGGADTLTLNLSGVTAANSAGLAVLVECKSIAHQSGKTVSFESIPDSLQKIAEVCQVKDLLA